MSQTSFQQSIAAVAQAPGQFYQTAKANGLMKRTSIFSRPGPRNGATFDQDTIDLDPSRPTPRSIGTCQAGLRPSTSTTTMERSQTDPTFSKRSSLFGSRKRFHRKATRDENGLNAEEAPRHSKSDEDDQCHIKKQSISQPFNFQHLSHTRRKHVPGLPTVDEKSQSRVQSSSTSDGSTGTRPTTPLLTSPPIGPHHSSSRSVDVTHGRHATLVGGGRPRAASCQTGNGPQRSPSVSQVVRLSFNNPNIPVNSETIPPVAAQVMHCTPSEVKYRAQQPLPALPQFSCSRRDSRRMTLDSQLSSSTSGETSSSRPDSRRSSNVRSITAVPWSSLNGRGSTTELTEASWEEDVDFCYEQEAESTCDFHWYEDYEEMDGGFRLSKFILPNEGPRASALYAPSAPTSPPQRKPSSIVGHRGFQHARTTSVIMEAADHEIVKEDAKPMFGPELMHLGTSLGSICDSASTRTGSSGHHKSNSCASFESGVHPALSSDNGHASIGSLNSVPELMHSSTACSSDEAITPQEPEIAVPPSLQPMPVCDIMRKPSTLSNRAILQAGRVVQRGRGSAPANGGMSRVPSTQTQEPLVEGEEVMTWI